MIHHYCWAALSLMVVGLARAAVSSFGSIPRPPESCVPAEASIGDKQAAVLVVKAYSRASADFQQYPEKLLSTRHYKLRNDSKLFNLAVNVSARFSGGNVCLSAVRLSVTDDGGKNERKKLSCERACLNTTRQDLKLILNSTEGGRAWPGNLCCVWATEHYLVLSLQRPSYRCATCRGNGCRRADVGTKQCAPGDRCFSLTLRQPSPPHKVRPLYSGCTSDVMFSGYSCWNSCRYSVRTLGSSPRSRVCLHCCTGDGCNKHFNATHVNMTSPSEPEKRNKCCTGKSSEKNLEDRSEVCKDYRAYGRAGRPSYVGFPVVLLVAIVWLFI